METGKSPMRWPSTINGHNVEVYERPEGGGVELIVAACNTCHIDLGTYDPVRYNKYRLAFYAAVAETERHANK